MKATDNRNSDRQIDRQIATSTTYVYKQNSTLALVVVVVVACEDLILHVCVHSMLAFIFHISCRRRRPPNPSFTSAFLYVHIRTLQLPSRILSVSFSAFIYLPS